MTVGDADARVRLSSVAPKRGFHAVWARGLDGAVDLTIENRTID